VNKSDYEKLVLKLFRGAQDTEFRVQAQEITLDWREAIRSKRDAAQFSKKLVVIMDSFQPWGRFIASLAPKKSSFINRLFSIDTTLFILATDNADDICVISSDPSTKNIYEYHMLYSEVLGSESDFFDFFVCGEHEMEESQYYTKITKGDWHAFSRST